MGEFDIADFVVGRCQKETLACEVHGIEHGGAAAIGTGGNGGKSPLPPLGRGGEGMFRGDEHYDIHTRVMDFERDES